MRLLVIRHGEAHGANPNTDDSVRELTETGRNDARRIAMRIAEADMRPALILCSNAVRARQTCEQFSQAIEHTGALTYCPELYNASAPGYYQVISAYAGHADPLAIIGHNPSAEEFVSNLCARHVSLSTASVAVVSCDCSRWDELAPGMGHLEDVIAQR